MTQVLSGPWVLSTLAPNEADSQTPPNSAFVKRDPEIHSCHVSNFLSPS